MGTVRSPPDRVGMLIRSLLPADRYAVEDALRASEAFSAIEIEVALQLLDDSLAGGSDYVLFGAEIDGAVRGYICLGRANLTVASWYLYWICVHPSAQGQGIGRALQAHAESFVKE